MLERIGGGVFAIRGALAAGRRGLGLLGPVMPRWGLQLPSPSWSALDEVAARTGRTGIFGVAVDDVVVWSREHEDGFPELEVLKQRVRYIVQPGRTLGRSDAG